MSAFVVAIALSGRLPDSVRDSLQRIEFPHGSIVSGVGEHAIVVVPSADPRVMLERAVGATTALCGSLLDRADSGDSPQTELRRAAHSLPAHAAAYLAQCRGTFAIAQVQTNPGNAIFATDRVGVRNLYYAQQAGMVFVATSLTLLARLRCLELSVDLTAVLEEATFGYPLDTRTPYSEVKCAPMAAMLRVNDGKLVISQYANIAATAQIEEPIERSAARLLADFRRSILTRRPAANALLGISGGMDSRIVAWALAELGVSVTGINLSPAGSQDRVFARQAAHAMKIAYVQHEFEHRGAFPFSQIIDDLLKSPAHSSLARACGYRVWSGDGGSVGLGCVLVEPPVVEALARADTVMAVECYFGLRALGTPLRVLSPQLREEARERPRAAFRRELERYSETRDPRRALHLALIANDQRRHCSAFWEHIPSLTIDQEFPFYDGDFVEQICATPVDQLVGHRVYHEMLLLCDTACATPWQTYPGHVPCPFPIPRALSYQWSRTMGSYRRPWKERVGLATRVMNLVRKGVLPNDLIHIPSVIAYCGLQLAGRADYAGPLGFVERLASLSVEVGGKVALETS